jgi:hypothetical protein
MSRDRKKKFRVKIVKLSTNLVSSSFSGSCDIDDGLAAAEKADRPSGGEQLVGRHRDRLKGQTRTCLNFEKPFLVF